VHEVSAALERALAELGQILPVDAPARLLVYLELLAKWNRTYNLTAIRDRRKMISHHLLDSLAVRPHLPPGPLADIGTGAGLPGIPIAIAEPAREVTLNDASSKKAAFLRQAVIELKLQNAHVHHGRVEDWRPATHFACVISRGYAELPRVIADSRPLLRPGGVIAAMKGALPRDELARIPAGVDCADIRRLAVPTLEGERHLVLCRCSA
jgi:16S rRNA (guanine527-N7)-methyltransferase